MFQLASQQGWGTNLGSSPSLFLTPPPTPRLHEAPPAEPFARSLAEQGWAGPTGPGESYAAGHPHGGPWRCPLSHGSPSVPAVLGQRLESSRRPLCSPCALSPARGFTKQRPRPGWRSGGGEGPEDAASKVSPAVMCPFTRWEVAVSKSATLTTSILGVSDSPG